ncbi:BOS complex subunit TMEM147 [Bactrocera oleae]|uniref:BOS complex subunit TMEM147 n=1 Tax=Bactrocera oleae TaxID=104688 RepID=UPI0006B7B8AE|nr:transmembrane protein 147 [Bactrocera oleae]XP_014089106.1 transmembrane protein 147 [Bactrocera oleae]XP_014089107.1 transmembrane protein 147 [Bactrocera oleae]XP_014089108.1 transmembrane protein 147 [Bactrocera oleae]XP_036222798.1 transmembrane protein 147 [Bactrocera oleae]
MTLYHFGNCVALVYVPYYLTYKYSGLSEYGAFWKCIQAGGIYIFTQLCKMLVLATFFDSDTLNGSGEGFCFLAELLKSSVNVADLLGFALILSRIPGKGHNKLITTGLGWAAAEVILSRGIMLWVGARGTEFSWIYILKCLESNVLLVQHITTATLMWLFSRHDLNKTLKPLVTILLALTIFKGVWLEGLLSVLTFGPWSTIAVKALIASIMGFMSLHIYTGLAQQIGI